ncbi:MAG: hypothetical protein KAS32_03235 [Candidatus Peribacteraceae bacterium]|nr:hypothetical protein [Candidatus Peribacteraceae bacterium]
MSTTLKKLALHKQYKKMVANRLRNPKCYVKIKENRESNSIAERLSSHLLAAIFMEAQFHAMPESWCENTFKMKYPPYNTCFGGNCWGRYQTYVKRGKRDAT